MISYLTKNVKMPSKSTLTSVKVEPYYIYIYISVFTFTFLLNIYIYIILTGELGRQAGMFLAWFK